VSANDAKAVIILESAIRTAIGPHFSWPATEIPVMASRKAARQSRSRDGLLQLSLWVFERVICKSGTSRGISLSKKQTAKGRE
jgi:hypothetical protein